MGENERRSLMEKVTRLATMIALTRPGVMQLQSEEQFLVMLSLNPEKARTPS
jgi:hypothetical protein